MKLTVKDTRDNYKLLKEVDFNNRANYKGEYWHWYNFLVENTTNQEYTVNGLQYKLWVNTQERLNTINSYQRGVNQ